MHNPIPKRLLIGTVFVAPALVLLWFRLQPHLDIAASLPLFHFYIVTFTTFSAAVVSVLLSATLRDVAQPRHYLAALAFAVIGVIFFAHGLATPGALIAYFHPAVGWSAWLTLFGGGVIFALAGLDGEHGLPAWLSVRRVTFLAVGGVSVYLLVAIFSPQLLIWIDDNADPWHRSVIFYITLGLWLFAAYRFGKIWQKTGSRVDGVLAFVAFWLGCAAVSMHQFPLWQLSWWLYHFILLLSFLITVYILLSEYEQTRQFSLLRYYLAASLIITALMALIASYLFAQFSFRVLVAEKEAGSTQLVTTVTNEVAKTLPGDSSPTQALAIYAGTLPTYAVGEVIVYDDNGLIVASGEPAYGYGEGANSDDTSIPVEYRFDYEQALSGEVVAKVWTPAGNGDNATYNPFGSLPTVAVYAPLYLSADSNEPPVGVALTLQAAQELNQAVLQARTAGLLITALSMSVLFGILLLVVARADRIITSRTQELAEAYKDLRQAEGMRDDLTSMIVHDLRNPLSIIYGTLGLAQRLNGQEHAETRTLYIGRALHASERMTGLIDDILAVSKIEAGQLEPKMEDTSVAILLSERLEGFTVQATEENKQLTISCPANLNVPLDPNMIGRVVDNLVSNALKYTDANGQIQIAAWADSGQVHIRVRDDGEGIPDNYKKHIFEKFAQAPNANENSTRKGTGLGLAFCGLAVQLHGGEIWVEDAPGGGSDFTFWLPQLQKVSE